VRIIVDKDITDEEVILMKDDNTYEIYNINDLIQVRSEINNILNEEIQKFEIEKSDDAWNILNVLYDKGYIDAKEILKEQLKKYADNEDKDITTIFNELIWNWKNEGEANTDKITRIIDACRRRGIDDRVE